jgi:hypothetical protein
MKNFKDCLKMTLVYPYYCSFSLQIYNCLFNVSLIFIFHSLLQIRTDFWPNWLGAAVTPWYCNREVLCSNVYWDTGYHDWSSSWFSPSSPGKIQGQYLGLDHYHFLPNPFRYIIHQSSYVGLFYRDVLIDDLSLFLLSFWPSVRALYSLTQACI